MKRLAEAVTAAGLGALLYEAFQYQPNGYVCLAAIVAFAVGLVAVGDLRTSR